MVITDNNNNNNVRCRHNTNNNSTQLNFKSVWRWRAMVRRVAAGRRARCALPGYGGAVRGGVQLRAEPKTGPIGPVCAEESTSMLSDGG